MKQREHTIEAHVVIASFVPTDDRYVVQTVTGPTIANDIKSARNLCDAHQQTDLQQSRLRRCCQGLVMLATVDAGTCTRCKVGMAETWEDDGTGEQVRPHAHQRGKVC